MIKVTEYTEQQQGAFAPEYFFEINHRIHGPYLSKDVCIERAAEILTSFSFQKKVNIFKRNVIGKVETDKNTDYISTILEKDVV